MSEDLEWAGTARGTILEYGLSQVESGAVAVNLVAKVDECWDADANAWVDYRSHDYRVRGDIWIVKKDGKPNQAQAQALIDFAGWDGSLEAITNGTWQPTPCSFVINEDTYKDVTRYRVSWLNAYDRTPGAIGNMTPDKVKVLQAQYGPQFRALAGNAKRAAAAPPTSKPIVPPAKAGNGTAPQPPVTDESARQVAEAATPADKIPF